MSQLDPLQTFAHRYCMAQGLKYYHLVIISYIDSIDYGSYEIIVRTFLLSGFLCWCVCRSNCWFSRTFCPSCFCWSSLSWWSPLCWWSSLCWSSLCWWSPLCWSPFCWWPLCWRGFSSRRCLCRGFSSCSPCFWFFRWLRHAGQRPGEVLVKHFKGITLLL